MAQKRIDRDRRHGRGGQGGRPRQGWRPTRDDRRGPRMSVAVAGRVGELGLDGRLRVILPPIELRVAEGLTFRGGADVVTSRGEGIGRVDTIVGTLEHPVVIVRIYDEAKRSVTDLAGKEVFLG